MNARHLAVLAVVAVVAVGAAFYSTSLREPQTSAASRMLVPGLKAALNDVDGIRIVTAGSETVVSLVRGDEQWTVEQQSNYPADTGNIRELLLNLADARLRESKTANPDNYHHLAVQDIAEADAAGVQVELSGVDSAPVIIGKAAAGTGDATYARLAGDSQSWLVSGSIDVARAPLDWLNRDVVDLPASRIQSVAVQHADGEELRISRQERSAPNFAVENVPEGRELASPTTAAPMGSVLQGLRFDGVQPVEAVQLTDVTTTQYRLFNGMVVTVESSSAQDNKAQVRFRVAFDEDLARRFVPPVEDFETVAGEAGEETLATPLSEPSFTAAKEEAQALDARLSPWVFQIPGYKHQQMSRRMDALLKALPEPDAG